MEQTYCIYSRAWVEVNTDPQRRCYNGCHYSSELRLTNWQKLEEVKHSKLEERLKFWRELNNYAVSQRGQSAKQEFKAEVI